MSNDERWIWDPLLGRYRNATTGRLVPAKRIQDLRDALLTAANVVVRLQRHARCRLATPRCARPGPTRLPGRLRARRGQRQTESAADHHPRHDVRRLERPGPRDG